MNVPPEVIEVVGQWVRKAEHDLEAAKRIIAIKEGCPFDTVCFHCQQAAEKYLKALLTYLGIEAPRSHDLIAIAALIPLESQFPVRPEELAELNPYAVNVRYADDWKDPQQEEAHRALELAFRVRAAVCKLLPTMLVQEAAKTGTKA